MPDAYTRPTWREALPTRRELFYGGAWHEPMSGKWQESASPGNGENLGQIAWAEEADVDAAVRAAYDGFRIWRAVKPLERARLLREAAVIIRAHGDELALIDAVDCGNPVRELVKDAGFAAASLEFFAGLVTELKGATIPMGDGVLNYTLREPLGVIVRINAFNHPFMFAAMRAGAPLAAGNCLIIKPPEQAGLSSLRLAELIGHLFPPGVFTVLPGGRECGQALVAHPLTAKIGLIGAVPTGKAIMKGAADGLKRIALELGGKNALIAYPDADPAKVAAGLVRGMNFAWCGQSCGSTSRAFLHESIHDAVLDHVVREVQAIRAGLPTDWDTDMGSLVSQAQLDRVIGFVESARSDGARLVTGGKRPPDPALAGGFFFEPTIFADVRPDMRIAREEVFGPVLSVLRWSDEAAMFGAVNGVEYGLTASIWTRDLALAHRAASRVEAGFVWVNGSSNHFLGAPFGGWKQSGLAPEESIEELLECTQIKNVNVTLEP